MNMFVIKAKFFNHQKRDWEYLQANGADELFDSHPDAQQEIMRRQPRAYNEDEFQLESYIVCECGALILQSSDMHECKDCGAVYDQWGKRIWTSFPRKSKK